MKVHRVVWGVALGTWLVVGGAGCGLRSSQSPRLSIAQVASAKARDATLSPVERGRFVYQKYGCAMCHGPDGQGGVKNPNAQTGGEIPKLTHVAEGYSVDELKTQIRKGLREIGKADSLGPAPPYRMPDMEGWMSEEELDALVHYLIGLMPKGAETTW